jgi:uncharacterized protein YfaS (alpha-2-macroglobulin family)
VVQADRTSTVQRIRVPEGFEGTGYVNVCFVRGLDSKEVFLSPLSYASASFQANIEKRRLPITLRAPAKHLPGEPLRIAIRPIGRRALLSSRWTKAFCR